jgi:hypothetical protein
MARVQGFKEAKGQGNRFKGRSYKGLAEDRGLLHDGGDTRSSPHLSVVTLGCLDVGDEGQRIGLPLKTTWPMA